MLVYTSLPVPIVISVVYLSILTPHAPTCGLHANYVYVIFADASDLLTYQRMAYAIKIVQMILNSFS